MLCNLISNDCILHRSYAVNAQDSCAYENIEKANASNNLIFVFKNDAQRIFDMLLIIVLFLRGTGIRYFVHANCTCVFFVLCFKHVDTENKTRKQNRIRYHLRKLSSCLEKA